MGATTLSYKDFDSEYVENETEEESLQSKKIILNYQDWGKH